MMTELNVPINADNDFYARWYHLLNQHTVDAGIWIVLRRIFKNLPYPFIN